MARRLAVAITAVLAPASAAAADVELKGFVASEYVYADDSTTAPLAPLLPPEPAGRAFVEVNAQPRLSAAGGSLVAAADLSLYLGTRDPGQLLLVNAATLSWQVEGAVTVLVGRRRLIWGSGLAANPTDLVDPPKHVVDPEQQRTGAFLLPEVEITTEALTVSAFFSPRVETTAAAVPDELDLAGGILGARLYSLLASTDVSLMLFRDLGRERTSAGLSLSRFLGDSVEVHGELHLWHAPPEPSPIALAPECAPPPSGAARLSASAVAGGRYDWPDQTTLSVEYLHRGEGLRADDFDALVAGIPCQLLRGGPRPEPEDPVGHPIEPPLALLRRHYLVMSFRRPHLAQDGPAADLALGALALAGLEDRSLLAQLRLSYRVAEGAAVSVTTLVSDSSGDRGELNLWPTRVMVLVDTRISY